MTSQDRRDESTDREPLDGSPRETAEGQPEMSRLLNSRRWETREGPFRGFESPPGRF